MNTQNSKRIINQTQKIKKESEPDSIKILDNDENYQIIINKNLIQKLTSFELSNSILTAISPLFLNKNFSNNNEIKHSEISNFKHIAFFIEHMPHYTGGRYSIYHQAVLLSQYTKVTVVTNNKPPFYNDFKDYYSKNFKIKTSINYLYDNEINEFDLIIGCPVKSGLYAEQYSKKFNLPLYLILFESPNWVKKFRDGADADENFWNEYRRCLAVADKIMVPSQESKIHLIEWFNNWGMNIKASMDNIKVVYPCLNQVVADKIKKHRINVKQKNHKYNVVYISRMTPGKTMVPILKKFPKTKYHFDLIGKIWSDTKYELEKLIKQGYDITIHNKINDEKKFKIIAEANVMAFPSKFEGFGMPPMEALYFNVPVVAYNLPVLKEVYGDKIEYVDLSNVSQFVGKIKQLCERKAEQGRVRVLKRENRYVNDMNFSLIKTCTNNLLDICDIPKISVGIIIYNGADYIEYVIKSIYEVVNQIIIVDGAVEKYDAKKSYSTDGTIEKIKKLKNEIDILDKIELVENDNKFYKNKIEMQNEIAKRIKGDYYVKMDADEIWKKETLLDAITYMQINKIDVLRMPFYHFWLSFKNIAVDSNGKWSTKHPRIWKWNNDFKHKNSFNFFQNKKGVKISAPNYNEQEYNGDRVYHFGYVRKLKILKQKLKYYKTRGIEKYFKDTVTAWNNLDDPTQPTQKSNSHATKFEGELPDILKNHPYFNVLDIRKYNE